MPPKAAQRIFDIFNSIFARDLSKEAPSPASLSGAGIGRADSVGSSEYLEGGSTFNHSVELNDLNDFLEVGEHTDRRARYLEYDRMENIPEISAALDTYADEVTAPDLHGKVFDIITSNQAVKDELEWLFDDLLQLDNEQLWSWCRNLCKNGDLFLELIIDADSPDLGIQKISELPQETLYRIETVRGRLLEFQQSYSGPDYKAVIDDIKEKSKAAQDMASPLHPSSSPTTTTGSYGGMGHALTKNLQAVVRFNREQIVHMRIGMKRRGFYPYGVSILYAGRRVAHLLKLMEDAMVIYRLTRAPERRIFYIDIGTLPPHKGEVVIERIRDKIKKKKLYNRQTGSIDERYNPWAADEDFFLPVRPESSTRIETLPGGSNLGEIDDTKYFREKLMVSLKLPKSYLFQDDINITRTSFASQDMRFARVTYRIQKIAAFGLKQIALRHLQLKGFPEEDVRSFKIKFTAPSEWLELSSSELLTSRFNLASSIKGSQIYDDYTILTAVLGHTHEESLIIIDRKEKQLLREQELSAQAQVFAQLATADEEEQPGETPGAITGEVPPTGEETPEIPSPEETSPEQEALPQEQPQAPSVLQPAERLPDFTDLEADEEEVDRGY